MNYSTYRFTLDIHQTRSQVSIPVFYQDTWVKFLINLTDGGKPYTLEGVEKVILYAKKKDGTTLTEECDIIDNYTRIEYPFSEQTASAIGPVECEFRLYSKEGGKHITTPSFIILVEERVVEDEDLIPSVSNPSAIDKMIDTEAARVEAETERIANEASRVEAEAERVKAETARVEADAKRQNLADTIDAKVAGKLDRIQTNLSADAVYTEQTNGIVRLRTLAWRPSASNVAQFSPKGTLKSKTATESDDTVPLAQMNEALAEKADTATVDTLTKKVANLEAGVAPDMFATDDTTAYIKPIPADSAPYAELRAVGGMLYVVSGNLYNANALSAENGKSYDSPDGSAYISVYDDGSIGVFPYDYMDEFAYYVTTAKFKDVFPGAEVGKQYVLTYDAAVDSSAEYGVGLGSIYPSGTFVLTDDIYNGGLTIDVGKAYEPADTYGTECCYSNITILEVGKPERVVREAKVTALDIVGKNLFDEKAITGGVNGNGAAWNEAVVVTDEYIKVTRGAYGNSLYLTPYQFFLQEGQSVSISADVFIPTGGAPTLGANFGIGNPIKGFKNSALYPKLSAYGQWERHAKTVKAKQSGWYYLGLQGDGNASQYDGMDVRFKNIKVTTDTTDTTYSPYHKHTFAIPEAVQALDGYGWGIAGASRTIFNGVEWDDNGKATFVKKVGKVVYNGTETWSRGTYQDAIKFEVGVPTMKPNGAICVDRYPNGIPSTTGVPCAAPTPWSVICFPTNPPDTVAEWKAQLAQWAAEGDPLTVYYELAEPIVTDISHLITDDNLIPVEGGGVIIAQNENEEAAPSTIIYQKRGV